jgi:hypothetical protein
MRNRTLLLLLSLFAIIHAKAQVAATATVISVEGFITNSAGQYIENVHVVNVSGSTGTTSNLQGQFHIDVYPGDAIRFTCVGYSAFRYQVPSEKQSPVIPLHIVMPEDTVFISSVEIYPWPADVQALKNAVLAMEVQTPDSPDLKLNDPKYYNTPIPGGRPAISTPGLANPGITISIPGPISALYDAFSKEAKSKRKFESLVNQDQIKVVAARRYNAGVVQRITSFKTDKEIQDFMLYCKLSVDFIVSSSEYDLYKAIHDCFVAYEAENKDKI